MIDTLRKAAPLAGLTLLLVYGSPAFTANETTGRVITHGECEEGLLSVDGWSVLNPRYREGNPAPGFKQFLMRHQDGFATFSSDGKYVLIRHFYYPNGTQTSVRRVDDGALVGTFLWKSPTNVDARVRSNQFVSDTQELRLVAGGTHDSSAKQIFVWHTKDEVDKPDVWTIPSFDARDLQPAPLLSTHSYTEQSSISANHPYIFDIKYAKLTNPEDGARFLARVHNWQTRTTLTLSDVSPTLPQIADVNSLIHNRFQMLAVPSADNRKVNLLHFADLEANFSRSGPTQYTFSFELSDPVKNLRFVPWAPILITQTVDGLQLWHAQRGSKIAEIPDGLWGDFEPFSEMGLLAIQLPNGELGLYSILERRFVKKLTGFSGFKLARILDHWEKGSAYLTSQSGHVFKVEEIFHNTDPTEYRITDMKVEDPTILTARYRTVVKTEKGSYFVTFSDLQRMDDAITYEHDILMTVFSLENAENVGEFVFHLGDSSGQYVLDPKRTRLFFSADKESTAMINLADFLKARDY